MVTPSRRRSVVEHLRAAYRVSERRACRATGFHRSSQRYRARRDPQVELRMRLKELAAARVRYGYRRLHVLLRREGWPVNAKRVHRLYREEGLAIRPKLPTRSGLRYRAGPAGGRRRQRCWAMDFMSDQLFDGRPFRILAVIDVPHARGARDGAETSFGPSRWSRSWTGSPPSGAGRGAGRQRPRSSPARCSTDGPT